MKPIFVPDPTASQRYGGFDCCWRSGERLLHALCSLHDRHVCLHVLLRPRELVQLLACVNREAPVVVAAWAARTGQCGRSVAASANLINPMSPSHCLHAAIAAVCILITTGLGHCAAIAAALRTCPGAGRE